MSQFMFMTINAQSLAGHAKRIALDSLIKDHKPDVVGVTETWLKKEMSFSMNNYKVVRSDRISRGGGVAVVIKCNIDHQRILLPTMISFEAVAIKLLHVDGSTTVFVSAYKKPSSNFDPNEWTRMLDSLP